MHILCIVLLYKPNVVYGLWSCNIYLFIVHDSGYITDFRSFIYNWWMIFTGKTVYINMYHNSEFDFCLWLDRCFDGLSFDPVSAEAVKLLKVVFGNCESHICMCVVVFSVFFFLVFHLNINGMLDWVLNINSLSLSSPYNPLWLTGLKAPT